MHKEYVMKNIKTTIVFALCLSLSMTVFGMEPPRDEAKGTSINTNDTFLHLREDCSEATESTDLEINNVRARLWVGGDVWWDKNNGRYVVPKPPVGSGLDEVSSLFAGGVWIGGVDPSGNLKLAASTYQTRGPDYYPGPLDAETGLTESTTCQQWDEFFKVTGNEVNKAIRDYDNAVEQGIEYKIEDTPDGVRYWPGQNNVYFEEEYAFALPETDAGLGAFWDQNGDGNYSPEGGDFPIIDIRGCEPETRKEAKELVPDEMIFWIYNDAGNTHRESFGDVINMEIQVQAFAYATNDEVNDMTFLRYKLINRAKEDIRDAYFAMWVDPDLGCSADDYIGCDVERSLAYTYNVDEIDGREGGSECDGVPTYGSEVPIICTDYFRGPIAPKVICADGEQGCDQHIIKISDDFSKFDYEVGDTILIRDPDLAAGEPANFGFELGMSSFIYSNRAGEGNPNPATVDPTVAEEFYSYLQGFWLDGVTPLTVGGDGFNPGSTDNTNYAFPNPPNDETGWSMCAEELQAGDRRTIQASGPFLLTPGAVNELIIGAVWVPDLDYPCPDITKLTTADDIAQNLFDNCFDIIDGPDAPTVCPVALDREIVLVLHNDLIESNNANFSYEELDIRSSESIPDSLRTYVFEGYKIFQLSGPGVSAQELDDIDKARRIVQVDINNGVSEIYNWTSSGDPREGQANIIWTPELQVEGADGGIESTFRITSDAFASGDSRLVNHKKYYYMAVAYAHNEYDAFDPDNALLTQANPYLEGRGNVQTYEVTPRPIVYEDLNAQYGDGVKITRIRGTGVGGSILQMEEGMHDLILSGQFADENGNNSRIEYKEGAGPLQVKVYNPIEVQDGKFRLEILGDHNEGPLCEINEGAEWRLTNLDTDEVFTSETPIDVVNEQLVANYGISLSIVQTNPAGSTLDRDNGAKAAIITYEEIDSPVWFRGLEHGLPDVPANELNAVARRLFEFVLSTEESPDSKAFATDPSGEFQSLGDGYWYPFMLTTALDREFNGIQIPYITPAWNQFSDEHSLLRPSGQNLIKDLNNVDIVMTSDPDKWTRCFVVETASKHYFINGEASRTMFDIKSLPSVNKNGDTGSGGNPDDPNSSNYIVNHNDDLPAGFGETGFSWFPGYAIDVETGKRLNMFFGENSAFNDNYSAARADGDTERFNVGADMLYNPTDDFQAGPLDPDFTGGIPNFEELIQNVFLGGQHFIYVTRQEYDGCTSMAEAYFDAPVPVLGKRSIYKSVTWSSMSFLADGQESLSYSEGVVPSDVTFNLRVEKPYNKEKQFDLEFADSSCDIVDGELGGMPVYEFEIQGKTAQALEQEDYEGALANINVVPNPYYAYSSYGTSNFDNIVKITNVPDKAVVTIYSLDGKFIKQFNRDETRTQRAGANPGVINSQTSPEIEWDLENTAGIPIASGVYLIHVSAEGLGERTIKWFGINRKFDPSGL